MTYYKKSSSVIDFSEYSIARGAFAGARVLIRVDYNVPVVNGRISDATRIERSMSTVQRLLDDRAVLILMSHRGRPKGRDAQLSLLPVAKYLQERMNVPVRWIEEINDDQAVKQVHQAKGPCIFLLENLRFYPGEKKGDASFAAALARYGTHYVNDAFGTAHRAHASTAMIAECFPGRSYLGMLMLDEITHLHKVLNDLRRPFVAIIGGAKVSDKLKVLENLIPKVDHLLIGGGMAYTFIRARGGHVGDSLVEKDLLPHVEALMDTAASYRTHIHLPVDSVIADRYTAEASTAVTPSDAIPKGWMGLDIGPNARKAFAEVIRTSGKVLWNGPMGVFEWPSFAEGTRAVAEAIGEATSHKGSYSVVGGGDSVAAINHFGLADQVSFISTGGGAMLEFIENKELPGIRAITGPYL